MGFALGRKTRLVFQVQEQKVAVPFRSKATGGSLETKIRHTGFETEDNGYYSNSQIQYKSYCTSLGKIHLKAVK